MYAVCLFDFTGTGDQNELHFKKDDVLEVLTTDGDWLKAKLNDRYGIVPRNYIQFLQDVKQAYTPSPINSQAIPFNIAPTNGIDTLVLQQFVMASAALNENQPIPQNIMNTYPIVKEQSLMLNERVNALQLEQNKLLELHSKMVHANQLYDQLMEYQMISKMTFNK